MGLRNQGEMAKRYLIPGAFCIGLAFFAGAQRNVFLGLIGFLSFFVVGVTLVVEGFKSRKKNK